MSGQGVGVWAWLVAGHAAVGALYWALVNVPESNVAMLALSALLVAGLIVVGGVVQLTALGALASRGGFGRVLGGSVTRLPWFLAALVVFAIFSWLAGRLDLWHANVGGEIDAWLIARFDAPNTGWLHQSIDGIVFALRFVVGLSLAVALAATPWALARGWRGWLGRGLHWQPLVVTAASLLVFVVLPWQGVEWRPASLPPTWVEVAFVTVKLAIGYALATVGWLLVLGVAARRCR